MPSDEGPGSEYLHVGYRFTEQCTVYRIRPNKSMWPGATYRGHLVVRQLAVKKDDGWYWRLTDD